MADLSITTTLTANGVDVSVLNQGPQAATQAVVSVSLPAQVNVSNAPATCTVATLASGQQVTCNLGQMEAGASQVLSFTITPALNDLSQVMAMATATSSDPDSGNNTASMGSSSDSADTPLPAWALWLLGAGLWWVRSRR